MEKFLPKIKKTFSRDGMFERWLSVESALASAQAQLGIIPVEAANEICKCSHINYLKLEKYDEIYEKTGHPIVSLLKLMEAAIGGDAGQYIHLGATTQDIIDTANVLAMKMVIDLVEQKLTACIRSACVMAEKYAEMPMMGRTHNIQALPITFGYKVAIWASELSRCLERLEESKPRVLTLQMSGAVGSMSSFGENGDAIQGLMAGELGLGVPDICWHASRDRLGEFACEMALLGGAFGRIAQEVYLLMGTEIAELSEYWGKGRVGSSTMPHKVNPTLTQHMKGRTTGLRYLSGAMQELMLVDHERNMQHSLEEQKVLEEICVYVIEVLDDGDELLKTLVVNEKNMKKNLNLLGGLTQSEHIMLELGKKIGKQNAHSLVNQIAVRSFEQGLNFEVELKKNSVISSVLEEEKIHQLLDPMCYLGKCQMMARRTAAKIEKKWNL